MRRLTTGIRSEKYVVRRFRRCANVIECTYTHLKYSLLHTCGPGSSVGIATDYGLDGPGSNQSASSSEAVRLCIKQVAPSSGGESESLAFATFILYIGQLEVAQFNHVSKYITKMGDIQNTLVFSFDIRSPRINAYQIHEWLD